MATIQVVLANGTTADANDVMANFTEIYTDIDETNIGVANKTGTGKIVLQDSPTINTPTISGAISLSTLTITTALNLHSGADLKIYSDAGTTLKFQVDGATGDAGIATGRKIFFDGADLAGDTYWWEQSNNILQAVVGGTARLNIITGSTNLVALPASTDLSIEPGRRIRLDGNDATATSIRESSSGVISFETNGSDSLIITSLGVEVQSGKDLAVMSGDEINLDGVGGNTSLRETGSGTGIIAFKNNGTDRVKLHPNGEIEGVAVDPPTANYMNPNGVVKGWAEITGAGSATASYNVSSVAKVGAGEYTVTWNTDFSSANYCVIATVQGAGPALATCVSTSAGVSTIYTWSTSGVATDVSFSVSAYGTQ